MLNVDEPLADGCMGATEFEPKIRKRYQTNELVVDSTEFGTRGRRFKSSLPDQSFHILTSQDESQMPSTWFLPTGSISESRLNTSVL